MTHTQNGADTPTCETKKKPILLDLLQLFSVFSTIGMIVKKFR